MTPTKKPMLLSFPLRPVQDDSRGSCGVLHSCPGRVWLSGPPPFRPATGLGTYQSNIRTYLLNYLSYCERVEEFICAAFMATVIQADLNCGCGFYLWGSLIKRLSDSVQFIWFHAIRIIKWNNLVDELNKTCSGQAVSPQNQKERKYFNIFFLHCDITVLDY